MRERQAILSADLSKDSRFRESESVANSSVRTLMCVPLLDHERHPAGILQIDTRSDHSRFSQDDLDLLAAVAVLVGVAVENAKLHSALIHQTQTEQETADAREVQKALLPSRTPELNGYAFWHFYEPARSVGGDYFDYLPIAPTDGNAPRWAIAVGDVVGKGMPAALLMAKLSAEVRLHVLSGSDLQTVVTRLNEDFARSGIESRFITFVLALIDRESHTMTVVSAGHMGPVIHRASGEIETFGEALGGTPLGIDAGCRYTAEVTPIHPGDRVVLYTDGVTEAIDAAGQCFKIDRLQRVIERTPGPIDVLGTEIIRAVRRHCGEHPQADDITLLCIGRLSMPPAGAKGSGAEAPRPRGWPGQLPSCPGGEATRGAGPRPRSLGSLPWAGQRGLTTRLPPATRPAVCRPRGRSASVLERGSRTLPVSSRLSWALSMPERAATSSRLRPADSRRLAE